MSYLEFTERNPDTSHQLPMQPAAVATGAPPNALRRNCSNDVGKNNVRIRTPPTQKRSGGSDFDATSFSLAFYRLGDDSRHRT
jgi:hypothetical protein